MQKEQFFEDQPILVSDLELAQSSKESAIEQRQRDLLDPGVIIGSQLLGEVSAMQVTNSADGVTSVGLFITVNTGVAVSPIAERIIIPSLITYNVANPIAVSDNGIGGTVLTPQSSGSLNVPVMDRSIPGGTINCIWVGYLETTDTTVFTISEGNNSRLFVKHDDGYTIAVTSAPSNGPAAYTNPDPSVYVLVAQVTTNGGLVTLINQTNFLQPATFSGTIPSLSPYQLSLIGSILPNLPPDLDRPNSIPAIPGFTYTAGAPAAGQFSVNFTTGTLTFNVANASTAITASFLVLNVCIQNSVTTGSTVGAQLHLNEKTLVYALGSEVTLTGHVNAYGSGVVGPNNPHGIGAADIGLASVNELGIVLADQGLVTPTGNASSTTSSLSPSAVFQALPPSANLVTIAPLIAGEYVNLSGSIVSATNIPIATTFSFVNPNTLAPLPAGTYYFYIDPTLLTVQQGTSLPTGAYPIASIMWNGATVVLPVTDLRTFGVIGKNNLRLEVLLGLATGAATDNRTTTLYSAKVIGSNIAVAPYSTFAVGGYTLDITVNGNPESVTFTGTLGSNLLISQVVEQIESAIPSITAVALDNQLKLLSSESIAVTSGTAATVLGFTGVATAGTSVSGVGPATTAAPSGLTFYVNINGDGAQAVNIPDTATTGALVASDMQAAIEALIAFNPGNQAAINATTVSYSAGTGYALLAYSAITGSTGIGSTVNGSLYITPTALTGITNFPPSTYSGVELGGSAPAAVAAMTAANTTYSNVVLASSGYTTILPTLDGQILTPGGYNAGAAHLATSGPATLTFNGAGNYTIYCSSTLVTGAGGIPTMNLTGGATAANILWVVGSSATLNSGTAGTFQGSVIANASITVTAGGTINGSLAALNGAATLTGTTIVNAPASGPAEYIITSGTVGSNSSVVITGAGAATLELGVPNGGTETTGSGGSTDSGNIKEILITGSTSSTGVAGQIIPAEMDLIYNGSGALIQVVAFMGNDTLTTNLIYNSDGSLNSIQEIVSF